MTVREQFDEAFDFSQHFFGPGGPEPHALLQSADQCSNKTHHPKPPFLFHGFCSHFSFFSPDHMTASPFCLWPYDHFFSLFMNIFMCLLGRSACAARGVGLFARDVFTGCGKSHPLEPPAPGRVLQGQSCPQAQSNHQQRKSDTPPRVGWKVTGRDILPSGHSQLTAINDTTHGGWGGTDLIQSFLCFHSLRVFFFSHKLFTLYAIIVGNQRQNLKRKLGLN